MSRMLRGHRTAIAWGGLIVWLLAFCISAALWGVPWSRDRMAIWLLGGLAAVSLTDLRRFLRGVVLDWAPLFVVLFAYDRLRGHADDFAQRAHTFPQLRGDEWLFGGTVPTVTLQQHFYRHGNPHWWDYVAWGVYTSHFFTGLIIAAVIWKVAYPRFRRYAATLVGLTLVGYATYVAFPAVPPWMASQQGDLQPTTRMVGFMWHHVGLNSAATMWEGGNKYANDVAAMPSLHAAYPVMFLIFFWSAGWKVRIPLMTYAAAMGVVLVYSAEHYATDIFVGWIYAIVICFVAARIAAYAERRRRGTAEGPTFAGRRAGEEQPEPGGVPMPEFELASTPTDN